jgi:membrane protein DedA with SNARE-associated domain
MQSLVAFLFSCVLLYKYLAIFVIAFLSASFCPLPSGTVLMASSAFAAQGYLQFSGVLTAALLGNLAGDNLSYWLTRLWGIEVLQKLGLKKVDRSLRYQRLQELLARHPMAIIFFSRFITGISPTVNILAGTTRLAYKKYFPFESLGILFYITFFCGAGLLFGANWDYLSEFSWQFWLILALAAMVVYLLAKLLVKQGRRHWQLFHRK